MDQQRGTQNRNVSLTTLQATIYFQGILLGFSFHKNCVGELKRENLIDAGFSRGEGDNAERVGEVVFSWSNR